MADFSHHTDAALQELLDRHRANLRFLELQKAEHDPIAVPLNLHNSAEREQAIVAALLAEIERRTQQSARNPLADGMPRGANPLGAVSSANPFEGPSAYPLGRDAEIERMLEKLARGHCSLVGASGSGKTLLLHHLRGLAARRLGWDAPGAVAALNCGLLANLTQLQQTLAQRLGVEQRGLARHLGALRLLLLDDLGGMDRGETGYKMRRWLRGLADDAGTRLLMVSHERLHILFAADDPSRGSLLAALDTRPVALPPFDLAACAALIADRLAGTAWSFADFADLIDGPLQPRELLHRCAERADELLRAGR